MNSHTIQEMETYDQFMSDKVKKIKHDPSLALNYSFNMDIESAYVITIKGHSVSERLAARCIESCQRHQIPIQRWPAFDGTSGIIKTPQELQDLKITKWLKVVDPYLSMTEVACALSHISLWARCVQLDRPIIVFEHDAIVVAPMKVHPIFGCIAYLGSQEQAKQGWSVVPTPPHSSHGYNYHFICRAHAYSIDPFVAKNMLAHVLRFGICESLDLMLRADLFPVLQLGLYAYDEPEGTTIVQRKRDVSGKTRKQP